MADILVLDSQPPALTDDKRHHLGALCSRSHAWPMGTATCLLLPKLSVVISVPLGVSSVPPLLLE